MMISDNERREIAARLREINPYRNHSYTIPYHRYIPAVEYLSELAGALGYSPKNDVSRLEFQNRLADLIEPSCDRDALLALADEMSMDGMDGLLIPMSEYARRIREALGVEHE